MWGFGGKGGLPPCPPRLGPGARMPGCMTSGIHLKRCATVNGRHAKTGPQTINQRVTAAVPARSSHGATRKAERAGWPRPLSSFLAWRLCRQSEGAPLGYSRSVTGVPAMRGCRASAGECPALARVPAVPARSASCDYARLSPLGGLGACPHDRRNGDWGGRWLLGAAGRRLRRSRACAGCVGQLAGPKHRGQAAAPLAKATSTPWGRDSLARLGVRLRTCRRGAACGIRPSSQHFRLTKSCRWVYNPSALFSHA